MADTIAGLIPLPIHPADYPSRPDVESVLGAEARRVVERFVHAADLAPAERSSVLDSVTVVEHEVVAPADPERWGAMGAVRWRAEVTWPEGWSTAAAERCAELARSDDADDAARWRALRDALAPLLEVRP